MTSTPNNQNRQPNDLALDLPQPDTWRQLGGYPHGQHDDFPPLAIICSAAGELQAKIRGGEAAARLLLQTALGDSGEFQESGLPDEAMPAVLVERCIKGHSPAYILLVRVRPETTHIRLLCQESDKQESARPLFIWQSGWAEGALPRTFEPSVTVDLLAAPAISSLAVQPQ